MTLVVWVIINSEAIGYTNYLDMAGVVVFSQPWKANMSKPGGNLLGFFNLLLIQKQLAETVYEGDYIAKHYGNWQGWICNIFSWLHDLQLMANQPDLFPSWSMQFLPLCQQGLLSFWKMNLSTLVLACVVVSADVEQKHGASLDGIESHVLNSVCHFGTVKTHPTLSCLLSPPAINCKLQFTFFN